MKRSSAAALTAASCLLVCTAGAQIRMAPGVCNELWSLAANCSFETWDFGTAPRNWEVQGPIVRKSSAFDDNAALPNDSLSMQLMISEQGFPYVVSFEDGGGHRIDTAFAAIRFSYLTGLQIADDRFLTLIRVADRSKAPPDNIVGTGELKLHGGATSRPTLGFSRASVPISYDDTIAVNAPYSFGLLVEIAFTMTTEFPSEPTIGSSVLVDNVFASKSRQISLNPTFNLLSSAASAWQSDAAVVAASSTSLDPDGLSERWEITYFSETATKVARVGARRFVVEFADIVVEEAVDVSQLASTLSFELGAFDGGPAAQAADDASNDFRGRHTDAVVSARLTRGLDSSDSSRLLWEFAYSSSAETLTLFVDPVDLSVAVGVEVAPELPEAIEILSSYPNPFATTTNLSYQLAAPGQVTARVIDMVGRIVRTTNLGLQPPGQHSMELEAAGLATGSYLVSLRTEDRAASRTVVLVK